MFLDITVINIVKTRQFPLSDEEKEILIIGGIAIIAIAAIALIPATGGSNLLLLLGV